MKKYFLFFLFCFSTFSQENFIEEKITLVEIPIIKNSTNHAVIVKEEKKENEKKNEIEVQEKGETFLLSPSNYYIFEEGKEWKKQQKIGMIQKEKKFREIQNRTSRIDSLGSAMGAIDLGSTPSHKIRVGAGVGNTEDSQAIAVGVGYAPTENFRINTKFSTSTDSLEKRGISFGASYDIDI